LKVKDILGRDILKKTKGLIFKLYDNGTVEKELILE
jgi:hypothetical protein